VLAGTQHAERHPVDAGCRMNIPDLSEHIEHFRARVMQEALAEATSSYHERRAAMFDWARPRDGDFTGQATAEQIAAQDQRLARVAQSCRAAARIAVLQDGRGPERVICPTCQTPTSLWSCSCGATRIDGEGRS
jgi:hypothetical protein